MDNRGLCVVCLDQTIQLDINQSIIILGLQVILQSVGSEV